MNPITSILTWVVLSLASIAVAQTANLETSSGWAKSLSNPVLGGELGTCFDVALLKEDGRFRMWFSWRPKKSLALVESADGERWSEPQVVFGPSPSNGWEADVNRPAVLKREDGYHLWFTGQSGGRSQIGYATSADGKSWTRITRQPVLSPQASWEKVAVMCPHVMWDSGLRLFRMWYSAGEQNEPDAIGYATSPDGISWTRSAANPIFRPGPTNSWDQYKVTGCQVIRQGDWHYMFYIGFRDEQHAQIGLARSRDGVSGWERNPGNPVVRPGRERWDEDACYKPFAIWNSDRWMLWYNGRRGDVEQIGLATHVGQDLGFGKAH